MHVVFNLHNDLSFRLRTLPLVTDEQTGTERSDGLPKITQAISGCVRIQIQVPSYSWLNSGSHILSYMIIPEFLGVSLFGTRVLAAQRYGGVKILDVSKSQEYHDLPAAARGQESSGMMSPQSLQKDQLGNTQISDISQVLARASLLSFKDQ